MERRSLERLNLEAEICQPTWLGFLALRSWGATESPRGGFFNFSQAQIPHRPLESELLVGFKVPQVTALCIRGSAPLD